MNRARRITTRRNAATPRTRAPSPAWLTLVMLGGLALMLWRARNSIGGMPGTLRGWHGRRGWRGYGLSQQDASAYIVGWFDYALGHADSPAGYAFGKAEREKFTTGQMLSWSVLGQVQAAASAIGSTSKAGLTKMVQDIRQVGTAEEVAAVEAVARDEGVVVPAGSTGAGFDLTVAGVTGAPWFWPVAAGGASVFLLGLVLLLARR